MKILRIRVFIISVSIFMLLAGCSDAAEHKIKKVEEPVIGYHNDFSTPLDVIKTLRYAVYSKKLNLLCSCFSEKTADRMMKYYGDDPELEKGNRDIIYFDLENKAQVETYTFEGEERATIKYLVNKEKERVYLLYKDGDRWYIR